MATDLFDSATIWFRMVFWIVHLFYYFEHSYAQSAVWAIWSVFCLIVYKVKQYEL